MEHVAHHDTLTNLPNRLLLQHKLRELLERAASAASGSAVLFIDLDRFKAVNDSYGHRAGDELLQLVAARLKGRVRGDDIVARVGGDEFVVLLQGLSSERETEGIAGDLIAQLSMPFVLSGGRQASIGASIGLTYLSAGINDVDSLIQQADAALYEAKQNGRGILRVFGAEPERPEPVGRTSVHPEVPGRGFGGLPAKTRQLERKPPKPRPGTCGEHETQEATRCSYRSSAQPRR